jgi:glutamine amidotransferase
MITIIDYGMGNIGSIKNMIKKVGYECEITSDIEIICKAEKLILPGVGKFDKAMSNLNELNLIEIIRQKANDGIPLLGICLGMQLLAYGSDEGIEKGLGLIPGFVKKFDIDNSLKIPHMGWNLIDYKKDILFKNFENFDESRFYFVHSFHYVCNDESSSLAKTRYDKMFTSAVHRNKIYGVQFHPEKSHKFGMQLMKNFIELI